MRVAVLPFVFLVACSNNEPPTNPPVAPPADTQTETATDEPAPAPAEPWDDQRAFLEVYEILRVGDAAKFEEFAGAAIEYEREHSISEDPPSRITVAPGDARQWLAAEAATWAASCLDVFEPPCLTYNQLSLGAMDDEAPQLECKDGCCRHEPALLHNTPFLREVCFDDQHRVTKVSVLDG